MNMEIAGLWPRNSFSGNICFQFSVLVLCSVPHLQDLFTSIFSSDPNLLVELLVLTLLPRRHVLLDVVHRHTHVIVSPENSTCNVGRGTWDVERGTWNVRRGTWDVERGMWNVGRGT
jgi:hypothetical protein